MEGPLCILAQGVTTLNQKSRHHAMKGRAVIKAHLRQRDEVVDVARRVIRIKSDHDLTKFRLDDGAWILLLEFHDRHGGTVSRARGGGQCLREALGVTGEVRDARNNERQVCARRRDGEAAVAKPLWGAA
jgi:hypothetical protein